MSVSPARPPGETATGQQHPLPQIEDYRGFLQNVLEASTEYSIIAADLEGRVLLWNEGARRVYGYTADEILGKDSRLLHPQEDLTEGMFERLFRTVLEKGKFEGVMRRQRKSGERFTARVVMTVVRDDAGRPLGYLIVSKDITEDELLHQRLIDSEEYNRGLIESNIDGLMTTDPLGIITDVNRRMEELTGYPRDELIGTPFKKYFTDPSRAEEGIRRVLAEDRVTNFELTLQSRSGSTTIVSYNATTFRNRDGKLKGVFAAAREVTEQKKLEADLRESQNYNRGLIEASLDALVTVDRNVVITDLNRQMESVIGYTREELIGTRFADYFTEPDRARAGVAQTFEAGIVTEYALTMVARTRRLLQVSFNASVFKDPAGNVRGIFASARDITDRVRLEEQLREQQTYLRGLIESSVDGLVTVDPEGFITDVNEQMCRMAEYTREELIGTSFKRYFTEPDCADTGVKRTFAEGVVTNYALTLRTKGGRKATVSFNASVFRGADNRVQGIFASARDISEQARLQTQLAEQQVYNRSLIEASADALFAIAPDGAIIDVNAEATRLTGYTRKHLVNSRFSGYFTDPERAREGVQQTMHD
ncbi:MAG TPA: PAS domain S-box protein, partial [Thermoplasmata archaeon]|nr:PAS domain S-box protein [Thermoplasmata archaeon]